MPLKKVPTYHWSIEKTSLELFQLFPAHPQRVGEAGRARALLPFIIAATEMYPCSLERKREYETMLMREDRP